MTSERLRSADVVPAAIPFVCKAVNDLMAKGKCFGAGELYSAIEAGMPHELAEFATVCFMRVYAGLQFAADEDRFAGMDPLQTTFSMEGDLIRCIDLAYLKACLLVPVRLAEGPGGAVRAAIDPVVLTSLVEVLQGGRRPSAGMVMH